MPYHADSSRHSQVAQEAQLAHYGLPTGGVPRTQTSRPSEYKGTLPHRKPVQTGTVRNQEGPYPSVTPIPSRKPVGGYRMVSSSSVRPQSPVPAKSSGYADRDKPLPRTPRAPSAFPSTPSVPSTPLPARIVPHTLSTPATPVTTQSRPGSSSGWSFRGRKRTDSDASNASGSSSRQRSRTGSFSSITEAAKKTGKWVSRKAEIVAMNPKEREALFAANQRQHEQDLELKRRRGEISRPLYQKQEFTRRSSGLEDVNAGLAESTHQAFKEHQADRQRRAALYKKQHARDVEAAARYGKRRPSTPQAAKLSPPSRRDSFTPSMNEAAKARFDGVDPELNRLRPKAADKYAKMLSEALDPFKRKDSDASLWLSDAAPPGTMDHCGKCGQAPQKMLQDGLCEACYRGRYFDPQITFAIDRKRGHNPKSPEDDARRGDLYMVLPNHRLRKVRETMYSDPGNPFAIESYIDPPLPPAEHEEDNGWETDNSESWPLPDTEVTQVASRAEREILSVFSDPFDLVNVHTDRETWSSFGSNRRSMSVDIGFLPMQGLIEGRRPSDVELSWPLNAPTIHVQHPSGTIFTADAKRDTKFYDFYDDILAEYETVESGNGTHYT